jgi:hypothetical protein
MSDINITEEQIRAWRNERIKRVTEGISAILATENCEVQAMPSFTPDGRVVAQIVIVPK